MVNPAQNEVVLPPFTVFNFEIELYLQGGTQAGGDQNQSSPICSAAFSECDGLEMTMEAKTIREGGNNTRPIHLVGPVSYGQLTLKRGMSRTLDLWDWFDRVVRQGEHKVRAAGQIVMLAADGQTEQLRFEIDGCLPVKLKAPAFNARDGLIAIEEMRIAYETLRVRSPSE